jgi:hypothetical protein
MARMKPKNHKNEAEGIAENIGDLDKKYRWKHYPGNYVQYLEMELHNAGMDDRPYHQKRMDFCKERLEWCGTDELLANNTRIGLGAAHYWAGDEPGGEATFREWIREDPDCGWAYSGWAECCISNSGEPQYGKAEEILLAGYGRGGLRDRECVAEGLASLYGEIGETAKAGEFSRMLSGLQPTEPEGGGRDSEPMPARAAKAGRNEPCPCGSGKKYKKCCGA